VVSQLIRKISEDKNGTGSLSRYPVRFLFLPNVDLYRQMLAYFPAGDTNFIHLRQFLSRPEGWLDHSEVASIIKKSPANKDTVVTGFSELARFYKKAELESLLLTLLVDIENRAENKDRRIYILCLGLFECFFNICREKHNRLRVYNPLIVDEQLTEENVKVYFTRTNSIGRMNDIQIKDVMEWLSIWQRREGVNNPLICTSKTLNYWYKYAQPDNVFEIESITDEREILNKIFGFEIKLPFIETEVKFWSQLLDEVYSRRDKSLKETIEAIFNVKDLFRVDLIKLWFSSSVTFNRWLLKAAICTFHPYLQVDDYTATVFKELSSYDDEEFIGSAWLLIFKYENPSFQLISERNKLIEKLRGYKISRGFFENELREFIKQLPIDSQLKLLTGATDTEKEIALELYQQNKCDIDSLIGCFHEIHDYIRDDTFVTNNKDILWQKEYFSEYRNAKLKNKYTPELKKLILGLNKSPEEFYSWYHVLPKIHELLEREKVDRIILLDGVGVEWLPFVIKKLSTRFINPVSVYIAKAELPSVTRYNNDFGAIPVHPIRDFDDNMIHTTYRFPESIVRSITMINNIISNKVYLKKEERIAIIADHGFSIVHRLTKSTKTYDFTDSEHDGRCLELKSKKIAPNEDYLVHTNKLGEKWIVALRDISLCNRSQYGVHGGATPEEVLVPMLIVAKKTVGAQYNINPQNLKITGLNRKVEFVISPRPEVIPMIRDDNGYLYPMIDETICWSVVLNDVRKQTIHVVIGNDVEEPFEVSTSFEEGDLFD
jgi:hypothetical protein